MAANYNDENDFIECDKITRDKIKIKLMDIKDMHNLTNIDCKSFEKNIDYDSIGYHEAKNRLDIFENISKLSVYLMNDYEIFINSTIQSAFKCPIYNTAMEKLGYQRYRSTWTLHSKPSQDIVIENIFKYCLYSYIVRKKNETHNKTNSYQQFPKKQDYYNDDRKKNQHPMKNEYFENQREQSYYRKQEKPSYNEDNNMKYRQEKPPYKEDNNMKYRQEKPPYYEDNIKYRQNNENTRNKTNRDNNKFDNTQVTRKYNDNQTNFDNYQQKIQNVERPPKNVEVSPKWKCKVCEMMNSSDRQCCEACDNKGPSFQSWACSQCTFNNSSHSVNCEVCGKTR